MKDFKWDSKEQEKGFGNLVKWLNQKEADCWLNEKEFDLEKKINHIAAYFIQKDHEAHEWYMEMFGNQIKMLQDEIRRLQQILS